MTDISDLLLFIPAIPLQGDSNVCLNTDNLCYNASILVISIMILT